ncbi:hypothetical protein UA08_00517 [Talaromyces atroroseus]|uniref:Major facilitator superfamily (MFS) profile domain-containing protein n=1 Tax=Talaromyces atroroseus TaxID=1441469 RepID=A0A225AS31_TALAT|nr:hypothetical protein UA08_00517 [Talaromyces atroroseus]OKL63800.1 hypothetical protein UA08_00517 [Talaromyces atroroseus]
MRLEECVDVTAEVHGDIVEFDGPDDAGNPLNWSIKKKLSIALVLAFCTFTVGFNSSLFSSGVSQVSREFHVSHEVGTLGVSLYVMGFATGPIAWAPLSELKGRRMPIVIGMFGFAVFSLGVASGKDIQTVLICRFWSGIFGASAMTLTAAVLADIFDGLARGPATTAFSINTLMGPMLAPSVGGFICESYLGWRWTAWLGALMGFAGLILGIVLLEETFAPTLLAQRAHRLRLETGNWSLHAKHEMLVIDTRALVSKYLSRPLILLFTEPLVFLISVYLAFVYGLMYLFLTAYPLCFQSIHGFSAGIAGLAYFGIAGGLVIGAVFVLCTQSSYYAKLKANHGVILPEWRLPPAMVGSVAFAGGVLWFGWSGYRADIPWIVPVLSGLLTGFGLLTIFQQLLNFLIDTYLPYAASVNAGSSIIRSLCGAGFPLFAESLFKSLGINWASTLLGGIAVLCIPIPWAFYRWGPNLRARSKYSVTQSVRMADGGD